ncbi:MAG: hypothetical protein KBT29_10870 [Prevotellaceae bacterium]|nr:hypothetical protein [Candidatus Minthosoma caballi]
MTSYCKISKLNTYLESISITGAGKENLPYGVEQGDGATSFSNERDLFSDGSFSGSLWGDEQ